MSLLRIPGDTTTGSQLNTTNGHWPPTTTPASNISNGMTTIPSAEMNGGSEVVEGLDLVPVPLGSTWLRFNGVNEYAQLFNGMYNENTTIDCGLPLILKELGDPLALSISYCTCDDEEDHTCWPDPVIR